MKKWITYTLGILITLVVLAVAGGMSYRMGFAQGAFATQNSDNPRMQFPHFANPHSFEKSFNQRGTDSQDNRFRAHEQGGERSRTHFLSPLLGILILAILVLILWGGYALYGKSGWQFVQVDAAPQNEPVPPTIVEDKKTRRKTKS